MCSPNFMATRFFTPKFILCANVTFEPEGDARAPGEHWGNGAGRCFDSAERNTVFHQKFRTMWWNGGKRVIFFLLARRKIKLQKLLLKRRLYRGVAAARAGAVSPHSQNSAGTTDTAVTLWLTGTEERKHEIFDAFESCCSRGKQCEEDDLCAQLRIQIGAEQFNPPVGPTALYM